ncbi:MAG TPA: tetraacyldisaccharide 4'-kinase [Candidatus Binataceae bacterium]|nr:tetraacyldisaccharide 4'-kinase [Candidatus Binataceae bacterium]
MSLDPTRLANRLRIERWWREDLAWYQWPLWMVLVPPSLLYSAAMTVRSALRRLPGIARRAGNLKVISVGNLTVGGNGKTPFTLYLARALASRGLRVGIVSRGYGGSKGGGEAQLVSDMREPRMGPAEAGDEAVMMAKFFDGPIAIAAKRRDAIRLLENHGSLDAVVLDDGFQQLGLVPEVNLVVVNLERGLGNGWVLPAGPMREHLRAVGRADAIILLSADANAHSAITPAQMEVFRRRMIFNGRIRPRTLVHHDQGTWREVPLDTLAARRVLAVSGIADARSFYEMLRQAEAELTGVLEYPDHYSYTLADWQRIARSAENADMVVTTEKDLVKLERFPFVRDFLYALRLEVRMDEDQDRLLEMIIEGEQSPLAAHG